MILISSLHELHNNKYLNLKEIGNMVFRFLKTNFHSIVKIDQARCVCLNVNETDIERAGSICKQNATEQCKRDKFLYCANGNISPHGFIIYKKGTITNQLGPGNCLGVFSTDGISNYFQALQCQNTFYALCTTETEIRQAIKSDWIHSIKQCYPHNLIPYNTYKQLNRIDKGMFWLANIRRPIIRNIVAGTTEARLSEDFEMACTGSQDFLDSALKCQSASSLQPPTPPSP
ncbi:Hypothetical predicted protein [Mytilus galloprovincialis]|uniref:Uncharacterized protein n=1 Tax=Mytilus galloprovincialis TaxID=29158 RepID=A0A8B6BPI4_MYTGA|nr:Hypothetical predicted protein [Mytilus galloprovincialis]